MKPYIKLDEAKLPDGSSLELYSHDKDYFIQQDGEIIMASRIHQSEEELSVLGCASIRSKADARVLVGGLGLGYTLAAALKELPPTAKVVVSEILPAVLEWNKEHVGHLCGYPLNDPRVEVRLEDVTDIIGNSHDEWDALLLDVDNAPDSMIVSTNAGMYSPRGLGVCRRSLRPNGVLAIWSGGTTRGFTKRLISCGFFAIEHQMNPRGIRGAKVHSIWIAKRVDDGSRLSGPSSHPNPRKDKRHASHSNAGFRTGGSRGGNNRTGGSRGGNNRTGGSRGGNDRTGGSRGGSNRSGGNREKRPGGKNKR